MEQEFTPSDLWHRFIGFEELVNPNSDLLGVVDLNVVRKFGPIEDGDRSLDVVMGDASTYSDGMMLEQAVLHHNEFHSQSLFAPLEYTEHNPTIVTTEPSPNSTAPKYFPSDPTISLNRHVKSEPIEVWQIPNIDSIQHWIKREETICNLEKPHINVDFANDQDDDMPVVLENPPTPHYDTSIHIDNFKFMTTTTELSISVKPVPIDDPPAANISLNTQDVLRVRRRRILFDAVVLKKLSPANAYRYSSLRYSSLPPLPNTKSVSEDDKVKLEFLRSNPDVKIKIKKTETSLSDEGIVHRLHALGPNGLDPYPIDIEDDIKMAIVTRVWISDTYGGSPRKCCPKIDKTKFTHGIDNFWFTTYEDSPNAPRMPGAPGLMFGCLRGGELITNQRLIMRTNRPWWLFMGIYDFVPSTPLSLEEWNAQSRTFREHWIRQLSSKKWAAPVRARIVLRNSLGREPTAKECQRALRDGSPVKLSSNLVREALNLGQEEISVWCVKCVGYDAEFQRDLASMSKRYAPEQKAEQEKAEKPKGKLGKAAQTRGIKPAKAVPKRKRQGA